MKSDPKKFFEPTPNYAALRELEEKNYHKPSKEEVRNFLEFWEEMYRIWKQNNPTFVELDYIEEKISVRKELIEKLGLRA